MGDCDMDCDMDCDFGGDCGDCGDCDIGDCDLFGDCGPNCGEDMCREYDCHIFDDCGPNCGDDLCKEYCNCADFKCDPQCGDVHLFPEDCNMQCGRCCDDEETFEMICRIGVSIFMCLFCFPLAFFFVPAMWAQYSSKRKREGEEIAGGCAAMIIMIFCIPVIACGCICCCAIFIGIIAGPASMVEHNTEVSSDANHEIDYYNQQVEDWLSEKGSFEANGYDFTLDYPNSDETDLLLMSTGSLLLKAGDTIIPPVETLGAAESYTIAYFSKKITIGDQFYTGEYEPFDSKKIDLSIGMFETSVPLFESVMVDCVFEDKCERCCEYHIGSYELCETPYCYHSHCEPCDWCGWQSDTCEEVAALTRIDIEHSPGQAYNGGLTQIGVWYDRIKGENDPLLFDNFEIDVIITSGAANSIPDAFNLPTPNDIAPTERDNSVLTGLIVFLIIFVICGVVGFAVVFFVCYFCAKSIKKKRSSYEVNPYSPKPREKAVPKRSNVYVQQKVVHSPPVVQRVVQAPPQRVVHHAPPQQVVYVQQPQRVQYVQQQQPQRVQYVQQPQRVQYVQQQPQRVQYVQQPQRVQYVQQQQQPHYAVTGVQPFNAHHQFPKDYSV